LRSCARNIRARARRQTRCAPDEQRRMRGGNHVNQAIVRLQTREELFSQVDRVA
jgi:hypothetical protein